jgi:hypothetical protein
MKEYYRDLKGRFCKKPLDNPSSKEDSDINPLFKVYKDLDINEEDKIEQIEEKLKRVLNLTSDDMKPHICTWLKSHAEELTLQLTNIAPHGDYEKLIEDNDGMAEFLKNETAKPENWKLSLISAYNKENSLIKFTFSTPSVDIGKSLRGLVFVGPKGNMRHAFVVAE